MGRPLASALLALAAAAGCSGGCELLAGPEKDIASQLKAVAPGTKIALDAGTLTVRRLASDRMLVKAEDDGYVAVFTMDFEGDLDGVRVSSLGLEKTPFHREGGRLVPKGPLVPVLGKILLALKARADAFNARDVAAYARLLADPYEEPGVDRAQYLARLADDFKAPTQLSLQVTAWNIRNERDRAEVLEEYEATFVTPKGPERHRGKARYVLKPAAGGFRFAEGLR